MERLVPRAVRRRRSLFPTSCYFHERGDVMTTRRLAPVSILACAVAAFVLASGGPGCGGRSLNAPHPDGGAAGDGAGAAGSGSGAAGATGGSIGTGVAGTPGTGAAGTGTAGAGAAGAGGHAGAGGGPACGPCPDIGCAMGFMSVVDPRVSCCPICRPVDCTTVDCVNPNCPSGSHAETPLGTCCPVCVAGSSQACNQAETAYQQLRKGSLEKYGASSCKADSDCKLVFENNSCVSSCGVALEVTVAGFFESNLASFANDCNQSCPMPDVAPCAPLVAVCSNGLCTTAGAPLGFP
jgi:hypothetical protein